MDQVVASARACLFRQNIMCVSDNQSIKQFALVGEKKAPPLGQHNMTLHQKPDAGLVALVCLLQIFF